MSIDFDSLLEGVNKKICGRGKIFMRVLCRAVFLREQYLARPGSSSGYRAGGFGGCLQIFQTVWGYEGIDFLICTLLL